MRGWVRAARPFSLTAALVPIVCGAGLAFEAGRFDVLNFVLVLVGGLGLQVGTNMVNDAYDVRYGVDTPERSRPDHAVFTARLDPALEGRAGVGMFLFTLALGVALAFRVGPVILIPVVLGALGGYFYTAPPLKYKYRGWSVPVVFWMMGPLMVWAAAYGIGGRVSGAFWWVSVPIGLLVASILHANDIRDAEGDRIGRVRTLAGAIGERGSLDVYGLLLFMPYGLLVAAVLGRAVPWFALVAFVTLPLARGVFVSAKGRKLHLLDARTAQLHLAFGVLLAAALFGGAHL